MAITDPEYNIGEPRRPKIMKVFFVKQPGSEKIQQVVLPVFGKGLWGTLYGYLALKSDWKRSRGSRSTSTRRRPGSAARSTIRIWKAQWEGRKLYDEMASPRRWFTRDRLPRATPTRWTGFPVQRSPVAASPICIRYWASDDGYGPFLRKLADQTWRRSRQEHKNHVK